MQEKHNARLGPKSQIIIQMQLNEGQYVMFVSNPDASHGFTWTHGTVKKLLNNCRSALIQLTISGKFIMRNRIQIKVSSLTPAEFEEYKKQNDPTVLNAMVKAQSRPETLTQNSGTYQPAYYPDETSGSARNTVQCRIQTQFPTTTVYVQNQPVQRNNVTHYGCMVRPPKRLTEEMYRLHSACLHWTKGVSVLYEPMK